MMCFETESVTLVCTHVKGATGSTSVSALMKNLAHVHELRVRSLDRFVRFIMT